MKKLRLVFMGTPHFAVGILEAIIKNNFEVAAVITAPDKPAGRGQKLNISAVKEYALEKGLKILQPTNLKDPDFIEELKQLKANCQVVVAFRMLPEVVWRMPEYGTFNLHASLLPQYRGAAPINWAIINGEEKTGVTTFFIDDKIDTGAIILSRETEILPNENAGQLHDRLIEIGSHAVIETLHKIENGITETTAQPEQEELKTAYKLNRENCKINWEQDAGTIHNQIRGLSPYPAAWCFLKDGDREWNVKIYESVCEIEKHNQKPGTVIIKNKEIRVAVKDGFVKILSLQFPGKKRMTSSELLNGMTLSENTIAL